MQINRINFSTPNFQAKRKPKKQPREVGPDERGITKFYSADGKLTKKIVSNGIDYIETNYYPSGQLKSQICPHGSSIYTEYWENGATKKIITSECIPYYFDKDGNLTGNSKD